MTHIEIIKIKNEYDAWSRQAVWPVDHKPLWYIIWKSAHNADIPPFIFNKERFRIEEIF